MSLHERLADPHLTLGGVPIPFSTHPVCFLGLNVQVPKNHFVARESILSRLRGMLVAFDQTPLSRKQKLHPYSGGVCPWLSWPRMIQEFPAIYLNGAERQTRGHRVLEDMVWAWKVSEHSSPVPPSISWWPNLPSLSTLHKRLQVSRQCQLLTSQNSCVWFLADCGLKRELRAM